MGGQHVGKETMKRNETEMTCERIILACDTARSTRKGVEGEDGRREKGDIVKVDKEIGRAHV